MRTILVTEIVSTAPDKTVLLSDHGVVVVDPVELALNMVANCYGQQVANELHESLKDIEYHHGPAKRRTTSIL